MPLSQSLDTVGPLAQTVEDCALLVGLMAGADPEDPTTSTLPVPNYMAATTGSLKGLKIGVPTAFYVDDLDPEVARVLDETIATLKKEGAEIVKVELPDQRQLTAACQIVLATEAAAFHKRWMIERPQLSFRRAARDLALSPSAISHQIRGLEAQFGVKLFVRGARSVRLTADGERYLAKVSVALKACRRPAATCCGTPRRRR